MRRSILVVSLFLVSCTSATGPKIKTIDDLGERLETLRKQYHIPALAAGMMKSDGTVWFQGMGRTADGLPPTEQSAFHLASLTKSFASAIVLELVAEGKVSLDDNTSKYGLSFSNSPNVRVVHLLTHTSEGVPGEKYLYNGNRYAQLDKVILTASGSTFVDLAEQRIIQPLGLTCTGPSNDPALAARLVPGFAPDGVTSVKYETHVNSAAGFVSCVQDMLKYSAAWDANAFLDKASVERAWTPMRANDGTVLPYGLGWFVSTVGGQRVIWHYRLWTGVSALIIKLPAQHLTFVLFANDEQLNREFDLGAGDLLSSPFAQAFLSWAQQ